MRALAALIAILSLAGCGGSGYFHVRTNIPAVAEAGRQAQLAMLKKVNCGPGMRAVIITQAGVTSNGRYTPSESAAFQYRCVADKSPK